ncbi:GDSL esterase/lipase APG [Linum perenne]
MLASLFLGLLLASWPHVHAQDALVPGLIIFGDSAVDVGNNDYLPTLFKANYPPYGRDFVTHQPTGRFCNGKLATDQLELFKEYKGKLAKAAGANRSATIISDSLYILSAGSSDFLQNYYVNPLLNKVYTPDQYGSFLIPSFTSFVKGLYNLGGRKLGVTSLPPLGCLPAARTIFGYHEQGCVSNINTEVQQFNKKVTSAAASLQKQLPGMKIVIFDIFKPLYDLVKKPSDFGFAEARRGCCGTGTVETTVLLCNPKSPGTCPNATQYVFWDSVHPSETLVPGLIIFGDSGVDVGNNNYLPTHFKANYPPYGRDFGTHHPTGRFCNGKLVTDITGIVYFMTLDGFFVLIWFGV